MEVCDQERYVISLCVINSKTAPQRIRQAYFDRLPTKDEERFGALREKSCELVYEDVFYFIGLLDLDTDADAVYAGLDEDLFVFVPRDSQRIEQHLWRTGSFNFRHIVSL